MNEEYFDTLHLSSAVIRAVWRWLIFSRATARNFKLLHC